MLWTDFSMYLFLHQISPFCFLSFRNSSKFLVAKSSPSSLPSFFHIFNTGIYRTPSPSPLLSPFLSFSFFLKMVDFSNCKVLSVIEGHGHVQPDISFDQAICVSFHNPQNNSQMSITSLPFMDEETEKLNDFLAVHNEQRTDSLKSGPQLPSSVFSFLFHLSKIPETFEPAPTVQKAQFKSVVSVHLSTKGHTDCLV